MGQRVEPGREAALRRVMEQERRVARQKAAVARLAANGLGAGHAKKLLTVMEESLRLLRAALKQYPDSDDSN